MLNVPPLSLRLYSEQDIAEVAVICALRRKGFPLQRMRRIMRWLQKEFGGRLADVVSTGSDYHLLTDGRRIYLENSQRQVIDILKNSRQPLLGICLSDAVRELRAEIFTRRPAQAQTIRGSRHAGFSRGGTEGLRRSGKRRSS